MGAEKSIYFNGRGNSITLQAEVLRAANGAGIPINRRRPLI